VRSDGERVHVGVLAADIVSYSQEFDEGQERLVRTLTRIVNEVLEDSDSGDDSGDVMRLPTGDGIIIVLLRQSSIAALELAIRLQERIRDGLINLPLRMGIHEGPGLLIRDAAGNRNIVGNVVNICQRVMDVGDVGHILVSESAYAAVKGSERFAKAIKPLDHGPVEVKHYLTLNVYKYSDGTFGVEADPVRLANNIGIRLASIGRTTDWRDLLTTERSLRMADISMPLFGTPALLDKLEQLIVSGVEVRVLVLNPLSLAAAIRRVSRSYDSENELDTTLDYVIRIVIGFRRRLERHGPAAMRRFDFRLFDTTPTFSCFLTDDRLHVSFYVEHLSGSRGPFFSAVKRPGGSRTGSLYEVVGDAFEVIWDERSLSIFSTEFMESARQLAQRNVETAQALAEVDLQSRLGLA
jgi:class 3 adenylate cyclase